MRKQSQSYKLSVLFNTGKVVTLEQMAKKLKVGRELIPSYIAEFVRVYGAKIDHEPHTKEWRMKGKVEVPMSGSAGKKAE